MKWEYIGKQKLSTGSRWRMYVPDMWRSRVPGGWLIIIVNITEMKSPAFYPDPEHLWNPMDDPESNTQLLRATGQPPSLPE